MREMKRNTLIMLLLAEIFIGLILLFLIIVSSSYTEAMMYPSVVSQDKSVCAAAGIELVNYTQRYESASEMAKHIPIRNNGTTMTCQTELPVSTLASRCKIETKTAGDMWILIATDGQTCSFSDIKGGFHNQEYSEGMRMNPVVDIFVLIAILDALAIIITIGLLLRPDSDGKTKK